MKITTLINTYINDLEKLLIQEGYLIQVNGFNYLQWLKFGKIFKDAYGNEEIKKINLHSHKYHYGYIDILKFKSTKRMEDYIRFMIRKYYKNLKELKNVK